MFKNIALFFITGLSNRLKEPFTWKGIFLVSSTFLGFNLSEDQQIAVMALGIALAGGVDLLPDSFLLKGSNKNLSDKILSKVDGKIQRQDHVDVSNIVQTQVILKSLGYYQGKIDGNWGRKTINAKLAFEQSSDFSPCIPNGGLPFDLSCDLPANIEYDPERKSIFLKEMPNVVPLNFSENTPNTDIVGFGDK